MKCLLAAMAWLIFNDSTDSFLIVDRDLKKPMASAKNFTTELYLKRYFPVYAAEAKALVEQADKAVKFLDSDSCNQTKKWSTGHTTILVEENCSETTTINIILVTRVDETASSFSFALLRSETVRRKAQQKLLRFTDYLNR